MKKLSKKLLCVISSAVLLCGASAIPASATKTLNGRRVPDARDIGRISESINDFKTISLLENDYMIDCEQTDITTDEGAYMTVRAGCNHKVDYSNTELKYQWYFNGKAINDATDSDYEAETPGKYYCVVTEESTGRIKIGVTGSFTRPINDTIAIEGSVDKLSKAVYQKVKRIPTYTTNTITVKRVSDLKITKQPKGAHLTNDETEYTLSVSASGGNAPYTYEWTMYTENCVRPWTVGDNSNTLKADSTGYYYCTITDKYGRTIDSDSVYVNFDPFRVEIEADYSGKEIEFRAVPKGGTGRYSYEWKMWNDYTIWREYKPSIVIYPTSHYKNAWKEKDKYSYSNDGNVYGAEYYCTVKELDENGREINSKKIDEYTVYSVGDKYFAYVKQANASKNYNYYDDIVWRKR